MQENDAGPAGAEYVAEAAAGPRPRVRAAAHLCAAIFIALFVFAVVMLVLNRHTQLASPTDARSQAATALLFGAFGWYLAVRRPEVRFGWLALAAAIGHGLGGAGAGWCVLSLTEGHRLPGAAPSLWCASWGSAVEPLALTLIWTTFPAGRLPRGRLRVLAVVSIALCAAGLLFGVLGPLPHDADTDHFGRLLNPLGTESLGAGSLPAWLPVPLFAGGLVLASLTIVLRWLTSSGEERQVLRWLAVVNGIGLLVTPFVVALPAGDLIATVGTFVELLVVAAVVLGYQVYGIDVVLNRTLVYVLLTAFVAGVYGAAVGLIALLGQSVGGPWTVLAALGAAFSLAPARRRLQRVVNRFLYGERDEPYAVVSQVAARVEAAAGVEHLLPGLLEALVTALRLPSAGVEMGADDGTTRRIVHGSQSAAAAPTVRFPLVHQGQDIGALVVGLRSGQTALDPRETRLLGDIARQVAVAASNVMLTEALVRSRQRIVAAAEEERRRLRRDLHDGLGPVLTAAATKVDAARNLTEKDPPRASRLLAVVRAELTTALADLRRLVYALRPPVLDELGLLAALREHLDHAGIPVVLSAPEDLPPLPAAVEIAAYRIITEAVTNVTRHARASSCAVVVGCDGRLSVEIRDDGPLVGGWAPGVGLTSMRERATALGGTWIAGPTETGGRVHVTLPLTLAASIPAPGAPPPDRPSPGSVADERPSAGRVAAGMAGMVAPAGSTE